MPPCNRRPSGAYFSILVLTIYRSALSPALAYTGLSVAALTPHRTRPASSCGHMRIPLCMVPGPKGSEPRSDPEGEGMHTYVEGLNLGSKEDELLAKGGDPFFLPDDDEDEDASEEIGQDFDDKEAAMPSMAFMSNVASMPGTLDVVGRGSSDSSNGSSADDKSSSSSIPFDGPLGAGGLHSRPEGEGFDEQRAALLDMGGDPFFLQEDEDEGVDVDEIKNEERFDAVEDEWDGWAVEDAHMDFD